MDSFSGLYQLLDSRVGTFSKLCRLQGKLELMLAQHSSLVGGQSTSDLATAINTPLLTVTAGGEKIQPVCLGLSNGFVCIFPLYRGFLHWQPRRRERRVRFRGIYVYGSDGFGWVLH